MCILKPWSQISAAGHLKGVFRWFWFTESSDSNCFRTGADPIMGPEPTHLLEILKPGASLLISGVCVISCVFSFAVKEAGRDLTYLVVVLVGITITGWKHSKYKTPEISFSLSVCLALALFNLLSLWFSGGLFYTIFRELFSSSSPNKIYGKALEKCRSHPEVSPQDWVTQTR